MFFRAKRVLARSWFNFNSRTILRTTPIHSSDSNLTVVSMLGHGEVVMYLLATKSFCRQLERNPSVVILDDGSLTESDIVTIHRHIPEARIATFSDVATDSCPKGNCWERLLLISDLVKSSYVVQIDSDTLTLNSIAEVKECIDSNWSFTLMGDRSYPDIEPMRSACARAKENPNTTVQEICEQSFDQLAEADSLKYVRGNAGFTGFAKGSIDREKIVWMSNLMRRIAKERWDEWGSEQVVSNLLMALTPYSFPSIFPSGRIQMSYTKMLLLFTLLVPIVFQVVSI